MTGEKVRRRGLGNFCVSRRDSGILERVFRYSQVEESASSSTDMVTQITGATEEQAAIVDEIVRAMDEMKNSVDELVGLLGQ